MQQIAFGCNQNKRLLNLIKQLFTTFTILSHMAFIDAKIKQVLQYEHGSITLLYLFRKL